MSILVAWRELKKKIREAFDEIDLPMLKRVGTDLEQRCYYLRANNGNHVEIIYCES